MNIIILSYDRHYTKMLFNKLRSAFHAFFFLLLINYFDNVLMKMIANNRTDALKTDVKLLFMITNCQINRSRSLTCPINYNERARISAVIVKYIYRIRTIWHRNPKSHSHSYPAVSVKIIIDGRKIHF